MSRISAVGSGRSFPTTSFDLARALGQRSSHLLLLLFIFAATFVVVQEIFLASLPPVLSRLQLFALVLVYFARLQVEISILDQFYSFSFH